ncbi:hypothetical protein WICPIJ_002123 [Wickerhamomyces pijperi]|uniref:Uncharacterized protein n=1 Tax=Wickerhamomyces pijperi TaxID=599730 RepID=A0A9P8QCA2_WICPI|nr:hypothetical protein WICPIJ_002123 [Wickerhamomyces pijperi]
MTSSLCWELRSVAIRVGPARVNWYRRSKDVMISSWSFVRRKEVTLSQMAPSDKLKEQSSPLVDERTRTREKDRIMAMSNARFELARNSLMSTNTVASSFGAGAKYEEMASMMSTVYPKSSPSTLCSLFSYLSRISERISLERGYQFSNVSLHHLRSIPALMLSSMYVSNSGDLNCAVAAKGLYEGCVGICASGGITMGVACIGLDISQARAGFQLGCSV